MRRLDGKPAQRKSFRYLLFPAGQPGRHIPMPGSGHSHVGLSYQRPGTAPNDHHHRRTLCGLVLRLYSTAYNRYTWKRYRKGEPIEWSRVTCAHCLRLRSTVEE